MAACPKLTELTIIYPHPYDAPVTVETARSATSELVDACKALPDFDTLQIVHLAVTKPSLNRWCGLTRCSKLRPYPEERKRELKGLMKDVKGWATDCLKKPRTGFQEGEARKTTTLRVIELSQDHPWPHLGPVKVEEYEV